MNILVIGDIMLDINYHGISNKIAQEAPIPVVLLKNKTYELGGAGYVANNLSELGMNVKLCGIVGNDEEGQKILEKINNG